MRVGSPETFSLTALPNSMQHVRFSNFFWSFLGCVAGDLRYKEHDGTYVDCKDKTSVC